MSIPCKTLNLWGNIAGHQHNPTNSCRVCPHKKLVDWGWGLSHTYSDKASGTRPKKKNGMTQARVITYTNRNDSKGIGHCCKKQDFIVTILIDLISSWNVTGIKVIRRKCSVNVYLSKFTLNKNLKFKDFIDVVFIFPRVLKFWFYLLKMYIVYISGLFIYTFPQSVTK